MLEAFDRGAHVRVLTEDRFNLYSRGQTGDFIDRLPDAVDDRDRVGVPLFHHGNVNRALAIDAHDVLLNLRSILDVADVAHQHRRLAAPDFHRYVVNRGRVVDHAV